MAEIPFETLTTRLKLDTSELSKGEREYQQATTRMGNQSRTASREVGNLNTSISSGSAQLLKYAAAGAVALAAITKITGAVADQVRAFADADAAQRQHQALLKATGFASGQTTQTLENMARAIGRETLASTQEVRKAQAQLLTFKNITGETFERTLRAAQDLASLGFGAITSTSVQLGKALEDPTKGMSALTRVGVSFSEAQKERIKGLQEENKLLAAQSILLEAVEGQAKGAAAGQAGGIAGSIDTLQEETKLLGEALGELVVAVTPVAGIITGMADAARAFAEWVRSKIPGLTGNVDTSLPLDQQLGQGRLLLDDARADLVATVKEEFPDIYAQAFVAFKEIDRFNISQAEQARGGTDVPIPPEVDLGSFEDFFAEYVTDPRVMDHLYNLEQRRMDEINQNMEVFADDTQTTRMLDEYMAMYNQLSELQHQMGQEIDQRIRSAELGGLRTQESLDEQRIREHQQRQLAGTTADRQSFPFRGLEPDESRSAYNEEILAEEENARKKQLAITASNFKAREAFREAERQGVADHWQQVFADYEAGLLAEMEFNSASAENYRKTQEEKERIQREFNQKMQDEFAEHIAKRLEIEEEAAEKEEKREKAKQSLVHALGLKGTLDFKKLGERDIQESMNIFMGQVAGFATALDSMSGHSRSAFQAMKALKLAQATISGLSAAVASYEAGAAIGGPPVGTIFAGISLASTGVMIGMIASQDFQGKALGGPVRPGELVEVNERGTEMVSVGGRDFLMMGSQGGNVTPANQVGGGGPVVNVINNTPNALPEPDVGLNGQGEVIILFESFEEYLTGRFAQGGNRISKAVKELVA